MTEARYNSATDTLGHEFLVFKLGAAEYGIDILKVREIRGCEPVTHVASMPTGIKGVVNLRGVIVPIVDLRERLAWRARNTPRRRSLSSWASAHEWWARSWTACPTC